MERKKASFTYKMLHDLRYRLMTALLFSILPIGIVSCILFGMLWNRTEREIRDSNQARLEEAMSYWERDSNTIDRAMEYFVSLYLAELNHDNLSWSDVTRYSMFSQLEKVLPGAEHNGMVALHDNHGGKTLAQMREPGMNALQMDGLVREFTRRIEAGEKMPDKTWQEIDGRYYLIKRYDYRNGSILFALDVGNSILERVEPLRKEETVIYVADGDKILELTDAGPVETELIWEDCTATTLNRSALYWSSGSLPIAVSVVDSSGILELLPWEYWVLLLAVVACIGNALHLPRLIRLEVLDPADKLRHAMQELQAEHLDFRLEDTCYRNSDDMQYLFDTIF